MYPNQKGDRLYGSLKSLFIAAAPLFMPSVITLRWSGRTLARSVVGPRPPVLVVLLTAFWYVATPLRVTIRGSPRILLNRVLLLLWLVKAQQLHLLLTKPKVMKMEAETAAGYLSDGGFH